MCPIHLLLYLDNYYEYPTSRKQNTAVDFEYTRFGANQGTAGYRRMTGSRFSRTNY